jgi:hypothetical protein
MEQGEGNQQRRSLSSSNRHVRQNKEAIMKTTLTAATKTHAREVGMEEQGENTTGRTPGPAEYAI